MCGNSMTKPNLLDDNYTNQADFPLFRLIFPVFIPPQYKSTRHADLHCQPNLDEDWAARSLL